MTGPRIPPPVAYKAKALDLWKRGIGADQIASRLSVSKPTIYSILDEAGARDGKRRYASSGAVSGGSGRDGFAGNAARRT